MTPSRTPLLERAAAPALLRWEGVLVCLVAWAFLLLVPLSMGGVGLGSDALNHHVYLGWTAQQHRFDRDFLGAGYQSFQSPYLYWPLYRMVAAGWGGQAAGLVLASLHVVVVWPVWMLARACLPGTTVFELALRGLAVALALLSGVLISALGSTLNDVLAAAPLVWAVALAVQAMAGDPPPRTVARQVFVSGLCAGVAVGLKLSNGPLAVAMPLLWLLAGRGWHQRAWVFACGCLGGVAGFLAAYGAWGTLLWRHFGNPVYPFYDYWFAPLRAWLGLGS